MIEATSGSLSPLEERAPIVFIDEE